MRVHVADHPLITHKLSVLRDRTTPSPTFRALTEELVTLLAYEATRNVRVTATPISTPVAQTMGVAIAKPRPLVVPILRAGLGMLEGMVKLVPTAEVGFLGMARNEETLEPQTYAERLPDDLSGPAVLRAGPDAGDRWHPRGRDRLPVRPRRRRTSRACASSVPPRGSAVEAAVGDRDVRSCSVPSTRGSTRTGTSSRASATPATACTDWPSSAHRRRTVRADG